MHYRGNHVSSFGSEKRGTPVQSQVRFSTEGTPIRNSSGVEYPDLLIIFHEALMDSHPECLTGVGAKTDVLVNSSLRPDQLTFPFGFRCARAATVDATKFARSQRAGVNAVLLGAAQIFLPELSGESIRDVLEGFFGGQESDLAARNIKAYEQGRKSVRMLAYSSSQSTLARTEKALPRFGWANAPVGGLITEPGNSVLKDNSVSRRGELPGLNVDACIGCGFCDMVCPDFCFVWDKSAEPPALKGIDYQYCKGCQKCISICPVDALALKAEADLPEENRNSRLFPGLDPAQIRTQWNQVATRDDASEAIREDSDDPTEAD
jgi:pyruvate ferredoxin oxidoreductase gamma subunit